MTLIPAECDELHSEGVLITEPSDPMIIRCFLIPLDRRGNEETKEKGKGKKKIELRIVIDRPI